MSSDKNQSDIFTIDFRYIERRLATEDIENFRSEVNKNTKILANDLGSFVRNKVKAKNQDKLMRYIAAFTSSSVSLGIIEARMAAQSVKQEDATHAAIKKGALARETTQKVRKQYPGLSVRLLRPKVIAERALVFGEEKKDISEGQIRRHLDPVP